MARIPIAEIPNVPFGETGVTRISTDGPRVNLMGVAADLQQRTMPLDAFSGEAKGLDDLGQATGKVAAVVEDLTKRMMRAMDAAGVAESERIFDETIATHGKATEGKPPDQWGNILTGLKEGAQKRLGGVKLSPEMRPQVEAHFERMFRQMEIDVAGRARAQTIESGRVEMLGAVERDFSKGDYERGFSRLDDGARFGFWTEDFAEKRKQDEEDMRKEETVAFLLENDPEALVGRLNDGSIQVAADRKDALMGEASHRAVVLQDYSLDELDRMLLTEKFASRRLIEDFGRARGLPKEDIDVRLRHIGQVEDHSIEGRAKTEEGFLDLSQRIRQMDPENLPDLREVRREIMRFPKGHAVKLREELELRRGGRSPLVDVAPLTRQMRRDGLLGDIATPEGRLNAVMRERQLNQSFEGFRKERGSSLTQEETRDWLHVQTQEEIERAVRNSAWGGKEAARSRLMYPPAMMLMPAPMSPGRKAEILKEIETLSPSR